MTIPTLLFLAYFTWIVQGVDPNSTSPTLPPTCDGSTRSVWSILGSCTLTLLICVWHAIHLDVDSSQQKTYNASTLIISAFFAPEAVVTIAAEQWWNAHQKVIAFRRRGYEWSMTHSFFAEMGGFNYRDEDGNLRTINSLEFLDLCEADKIANPVIAAREIKDKSKSDALAKAVLVVQLLWFALQVVVRSSRGLAVTLLELDTICMAALSLLVLWLWWRKPYHPRNPHTFYYSPPGVELYPRERSILENAWKSEPSYLFAIMAQFFCAQRTQSASDEEEAALVNTEIMPVKDVRSLSDMLVDKIDEGYITAGSLLLTWILLGALHLIAWNFDFPTQVEKILWRVASLALAGTPLIFCCVGIALEFVHVHDDLVGILGFIFLVVAGVSRTLLAALMLAGLRSLPPTAYQTIPWTTYIPHL